VKVRMRQLLNEQWVVEVRPWYWKWVAVYVDRTRATQGSINQGVYEVPHIVHQPVGSNNYCLTWHSDLEKALKTFNDVQALFGKSS
jgi:hypothetical protein